MDVRNDVIISDLFRYQLYPRVLRDVSGCNTSTTILGHAISMPVCVAPTAMQRMAHADGEIATARGTIAYIVYFFSPYLIGMITIG